MCRSIAVVVAVALALVGCSDNWSLPRLGEPRYPVLGPAPCSKPVEDPEYVSIAKLLARPEKYEGRAVRVRGYYQRGFEHSAIYLHQDDAKHFITANGFWVLGLSRSAPADQYVTISGIFTASSGGHLGQWPATICGVTG